MPRWSLVVLAIAAVVCAGTGVSLTGAFTPSGPVSFGWTAYAPLSKTVYSGSYTPINTTWLLWAPRLGIALLALGAGTIGAVITALLLRRRVPINKRPVRLATREMSRWPVREMVRSRAAETFYSGATSSTHVADAGTWLTLGATQLVIEG